MQFVDLKTQYDQIKAEVDAAIQEVIDSSIFIKGPIVQAFEEQLATYLNISHVIGCANGTDALQIALMALDLPSDAEVIVPAFTYVATAEVIGLLGYTPVIVDVDPLTFNINPKTLEAAITPRTRAIVPVHLFGQTCDMESIMVIAEVHSLYVIEDNAQSIGGSVHVNNKAFRSGTVGHIGTTSFFPSKNLGCFGDGGALFTQDADLAERIRMIANHGQAKKYHHEVLGCNSRLDSIQAAVLSVKLKYLDTYIKRRQEAANYYDQHLTTIDGLTIPHRCTYSDHVFHQYTLKVERRDQLKAHLEQKGIPTMIYYPKPLHEQAAYSNYSDGSGLEISTELCNQVLSLPMHTELDEATQNIIIEAITSFK